MTTQLKFPEISEQFMDLPQGYVLLNEIAARQIRAYLVALRHRVEIEQMNRRRMCDAADMQDMIDSISEYEKVLG